MKRKLPSHFVDKAGKVIRAHYPEENENYKTRISKQLLTKLKNNKWWWEGKNLYIKYTFDHEFKPIKILLLLISHDIRVHYPKVNRRVAKFMFTLEEINKLKSKQSAI